MALRIITGIPGAGKSYFMVNHIAMNYCTKFGDSYNLRETAEDDDKPGFKLVTNVEGLKLHTDDLEEVLEKAGGMDNFFLHDVQKEISEKYRKKNIRIVYIIDEAQQYFPRKYYNEAVFFFFQKHRHFGIDIYLLTQDNSFIPKDIMRLAECEIRAVPRSCAVGGFTYAKKVQGQKQNTIFIRRKKSIFALYKSMSQEETEKIKNPLIKYLLILPVLICFSIYTFVQQFSPKEAKASAPVASVPVASASVVPGTIHQASKKGNRPYIDFKWVPVNYVLVDDDLQIVNPITNELDKQTDFPFELKVSGRELFVKISSDYFGFLEGRSGEQENEI